ncbi:excinuclease ABC subunit UvrC [Paramaledivibacter caminithermalis]|jgi:excinuclease ABC subunit C|uniref:UvrABC system protein C n=1 Tax=Paramaledivibacter caminithermalis (strain DSM 15212 / CIP 107654 / DViRD3) TaxID=1121301 RepID=A0A1M6KVI1_PARC5|nr:excinuclease ABC subunit UvrC [Paramaledivibacter caminithermalis]SHJ62854.1 Excinuclease ABC subunit C [Paramaledivibacter caminithermalis DSM 15212]
MFNIKEQLKKLPEKPGVYIMKDEMGDIIYIGKSKSLKNRVSQYFHSSKSHPPKVLAMVKCIKDFEYIITDTEVEALILEANLIKKHKPRYNIALKDDKNYPYIKVTIKDKYPRVIKTRKIIKDNARYFGPYISVDAVNKTLETIEELFPLRKCNRNLETNKERPCLNFHIKKCLGPCNGGITHEEYMEIVKQILLLLGGKHEILMDELKERMLKASEELDFETAAKYRDRINALNNLLERQKIFSTSDVNQDYISMARSLDRSCVMVFFIRNGKLIGREQHILEETQDIERSEILSTFVKQFYSRTAFVPKEIMMDEIIDDVELIESWLSQKRGSKVTIKQPIRGEKRKLIELVHRNALEYLTKFEEKINNEKKYSETALNQLKELLSLSNTPRRIEAYDISNIYGVFSVGSMVVFENGKPLNSGYRRFKIKTIEGPNDYGSMQEVLYRRFKRGVEEKQMLNDQGLSYIEGKFSFFPDLILVDGGKGQVKAVKEVLSALNVNIPVAGMVKDDKHRTKGIIYENIELSLDKRSHAFKLIARIQDEVHRFAITYHKTIRDKSLIQSVLDEIPGIGKKRKQELLKHFRSIENIRKASIDELQDVEGMNEKLARSVYDFFRKVKN